MLLRRYRSDEWDWRLLRQLSTRYGLESWIEYCLGTVAELSDTPLPEQALGHTGTGWERSLQNREINSRGNEARTLLVKYARRNGIRARGSSPVSIPTSRYQSRGVLRSQLLKALESGPLTPLKPEGIDLGRISMGPSFLDGWSIPEAAGRWSDGPRALIALDAQDFAADEPISVCLDFHANNIPHLAFSCCAGGVTNRWSFAAGHGATDQLIVDGKIIVVAGRRILLIRFDFEGVFDMQTRRQRGDESRALGIFLRRLTFASERYARALENVVHANTTAFQCDDHLAAGAIRKQLDGGRWVIAALSTFDFLSGDWILSGLRSRNIFRPMVDRGF